MNMKTEYDGPIQFLKSEPESITTLGGDMIVTRNVGMVLGDAMGNQAMAWASLILTPDLLEKDKDQAERLMTAKNGDKVRVVGQLISAGSGRSGSRIGILVGVSNSGAVPG